MRTISVLYRQKKTGERATMTINVVDSVSVHEVMAYMRAIGIPKKRVISVFMAEVVLNEKR